MARTSKYSNMAQVQNDTAACRVGIYLRLSKEDGDKEDGDKFESDSISNQQLIIEDYLIENPDLTIVDTYSDDGYTGTNFARPGFQRLLEDIAAGKVNCVVVKDLSRFGRNYIESGQYLEVFFKVMDVRFISVIDNIDSHLYPESMNNISVPFKNVMNEEYCRDISIKIKSIFSLKRENGEYIGGFAPYGYKKDPANKNKLIIDDEAASVVQMIFQMFAQGTAIYQIACKLNELGIPNPSKQKQARGLKFRNPSHTVNDGLWGATTIRHILTNRMVIGDMVQGKREKISHKVDKIRNIREDKWIIVEGTHEPIIDKVAFYNVQNMLKRDTRVSQKTKKLGLFAGFLRCADCGRALVKKRTNNPNNNYHYFVCRTYEMHKGACTRHTLRSDKLEKIMFDFISKYVEFAVQMDDLIERINNSPIKNVATARTVKTIEDKENEKKRIEHILMELYPDWKNGMISQEQYVSLKSKHDLELERVKRELATLQQAYGAEKEGLEGKNDFMQTFVKHANFEKLTREMLIELVNSIEVKENGELQINLKYGDDFARAREYIESNKHIAEVAI